jgi:cytochrome c biogenesis protein
MAGRKGRTAPDMTVVELARWSWRQLTSMRTALVLLFLLALAAVPGSVIPQEDIDAFAASQWREDHPKLTPYYEKLGLFSVFDSVWFSAIYLLLVVSLVGCILPRTRVYWRALRAAPPAAPRNLSRLPDSTAYSTDAPAEDVLAAARAELRKRRFRVVVSTGSTTGGSTSGDAVSAERGYLREAGNLLFHLSVLVVLAGFAIGSLWGYKGGAIVVEDTQFSNTLTQYDDFVPGSFTQADDLDPFSFTVEDFDITWLTSGPGAGMAREFGADLRYREEPGADEESYRLRVNHPLGLGGTHVFLIGHGYAPIITIRDGNGDVAYRGPTPFLPEDQVNFTSFGVVKAPDARPRQIGLEGLFFPSYVKVDGNPVSVFGDDKNPTLSLQAYVGDLGLDSGAGQSVYQLDKSRLELLEKSDGSMFRVDLQLCPPEEKGCTRNTVELPEGAGSVTFEGVQPWVRVQVSKTPGTWLALTGVILALIGLLGSLFLRPRRVWVRARREDGVTLVEVAGLDRSSGGDVATELDGIVAALQSAAPQAAGPKPGAPKPGAPKPGAPDDVPEETK